MSIVMRHKTDLKISVLKKEGIPIRKSNEIFISAFFALHFHYYYFIENKFNLNQ